MTAPGVNIYSGSADPLGAALTNPTLLSKRKGTIKQDYPVRVGLATYPDAEAAYQALKTSVPAEKNLILLKIIIAAKLTQHPRLLRAIETRGGVAWLETCEHTTHAKSEAFAWWEGQGSASPMIRCLIGGFLLATGGLDQDSINDLVAELQAGTPDSEEGD